MCYVPTFKEAVYERKLIELIESLPVQDAQLHMHEYVRQKICL